MGPTMKEGKPIGYCEANPNQAFESNQSNNQQLKPGLIFFSYDVEFYESEKTAESRVHDYQVLGSDEIHKWSLIISSVVILVLICIVGFIFKTTGRKNNRIYPGIIINENMHQECWKKLAGHVFRPPESLALLSTFVGTGVQNLSSSLLILILVCSGVIDKYRRGNILLFGLFINALLGFLSGYFSARLGKMFLGSSPYDSRACAIAFFPTFLYPGINFVGFIIINNIIIPSASSNVFNSLHYFTTFFQVWFAVMIHCASLGNRFGNSRKTLENPSTFNSASVPIKSSSFLYLSLSLLGGLLPFGSIFIELKFLMTSNWQHSFYYFYSYLLAALVILAIISALVSIIVTYLHLNNGNPRTWWASFFSTGSVGLYIFGYGILYSFKELNLIGLSSRFVYFGYMLALSLFFTILCGAIGFLASYWFIRKIYQSLHESLIFRGNDQENAENDESPEVNPESAEQNALNGV